MQVMSSTPTPEELLKKALEHHRNGALDEAEKSYRAVLAQTPDQPDALHLLGALQDQKGNTEEAISLLSRSLTLRPDHAETLNNFGLALMSQKRVEEAYEAFARATLLAPGYAEAWYNRGRMERLLSKLTGALYSFREVVRIAPQAAEGHFLLAETLASAHNMEEAIAAASRGITLFPEHADLLSLLGKLYLFTPGHVDKAEAVLKRSLALNEHSAEAWYLLGDALRRNHRAKEAITAYDRALALAPELAEALVGKGLLLQAMCRPEEAVACFEQTLTIRPENTEAHNLLLVALHQMPGVAPEKLSLQAQNFGKLYASVPETPLPAPRDPDKRLTIGFVSADFGIHPVGRFLLPLLPAFHSEHFSVRLYANRVHEDELTTQLKHHAADYIPIARMTDAEAAARMRVDGVDIAIDLAGHMQGNRLGVFAHRAAPVQASWLGYFDTTGLKAMDYVIADNTVLPADDETYYTETPLRLPGCYLAFAMHEQFPEVAPLPALKNGFVTFGSFNYPAKIHPGVIRLWARVLKATPSSRLLLKGQSFGLDGVHEVFLEQFAAEGIGAERVTLDTESSHTETLARYADMDIALDPFPYNGGTTTCEALAMGVPVITKRGDRFSARVGETLLQAAGMANTIAENDDAYVMLASSLAADIPALAAMRAGLRTQLKSSVLLDTRGFADRFQTALREIWHRACRTAEAA